MATLTFQRFAPAAEDAYNHRLRSAYVETFYLPILGPTSTWLLRRVDAMLDASPGEPCRVDSDELAAQLGLGKSAPANCPFRRALERLECFHAAVGATSSDAETWAIVRTLPSLSPRLLSRLTPTLRRSHDVALGLARRVA